MPAEDRPPFVFVEDEPRLKESLCRIEGMERAGIDTEFRRTKTYFPVLALVQVSDGNSSFLFDAMKLDLRPLMDILARKEIIIHSGTQDFEILDYEYGFRPARIRDTQVACRFLGYPQQWGLGGLVEEMLQIKIGKEFSFSDWTRRPLSQEQLEYAHEDVIFLCRLDELLAKRLDGAGMQAFFLEECGFGNMVKDPLPSLAVKLIRPEDPPIRKAVMQDILVWREDGAKRRNIPRTWLLKDAQLVQLAKEPDSAKWLPEGILSEGLFRKSREEFEAIHRKHHHLWGQPRPPGSTIERIKNLVKVFKEAAQKVMAERGLPADFLCPQRILQQAAERVALEGLEKVDIEGWRGLLLNGPFSEALARESLPRKARQGSA